MTNIKFEDLHLSREILDSIDDMGFEIASPIQAKAIPQILEGKDIIGQAQTGTGKTAAFAIPTIEKLDTQCSKIQAIVLCPTRELAIQVTDEFRKLMTFKDNFVAISIYGGQPIERQFKALKKKPQVIVGTPGRTMDHLRRGTMDISDLKIVVLDEADEMLDMGFREDIETILKDTPEERQTVMFSATMPPEIIKLTEKFLKTPEIIDVTEEKFSGPKIDQCYYEVKKKNKPELLARIIDFKNIKRGLVFCNKKTEVESLVELLKQRGIFADALHGDMGQNNRNRIMNSFKNGTSEILVATDVAGRGIDVNDIQAVFNYDVPQDDEDYIHRIGRTARAGKSGTSYTFVTDADFDKLRKIERKHGLTIEKHQPPTVAQIESLKIDTYTSKLSKLIDSTDLSKYKEQIQQLMFEDYDPVEIAAALLKISIELESTKYDQAVDLNRPVKQRRRESNRNKEFAQNRIARKKTSDSNKSSERSGERSFKRKSSDRDRKFSFKEGRGRKTGGFKKRRSK